MTVTGDDVVIRVLDADAADDFRDPVLELWIEAFGPVDDEPAWNDERWNRHRLRADYRLAVALAGNELAGFSWGYTGDRGQPWADLICERLPEVGAEWIGGHFELVELAVSTSYRGRCLGGALIDAMLDGLSHERALLSTSTRPDDPAPRLYRTKGWRTLGLVDHANQLMGIRLEQLPHLDSNQEPIG